MSDNLRRYRARREAFTPWYPGQPSGTVARPLLTLAALSSGIVGSKSPQLPPSAATVPHGPQPDSRGKRLARGVDHAHSLEAVDLLPSADIWLRPLALQTVGLGMDGSGVGRGGTPLMLHVVSQGRALPAGLAGTPSPAGARARSAPYRLRRTHPRAEPRGGASGGARRWGMRWDEAAAHARAGGLGLRVPHGHEHRGAGGGGALPPGGARRVSQAGQGERVKGG
jgi:hypothetical protein